jgi:hypothetical protein
MLELDATNASSAMKKINLLHEKTHFESSGILYKPVIVPPVAINPEIE